jgi:hypothetical protein
MRFLKNTQISNFIKICSEGLTTEGDMTGLMDAFGSFGKAP